jgi:hypothetical protein
MDPTLIDLTLEESELQYNTDEEYLDVVHRIFRIPKVKKQEEEQEGMGEEDDIGEDIIARFLDHVAEFTYDKPHWHHLYVKAATTFLSDEPDIGLPVLLSYSYLQRFYQLLQMESQEKSQDPAFQTIYNELLQSFDNRSDTTTEEALV